MKINGWKYYNHAAIPDCAPHETPDVTPVKDGSIWKLDGAPLLARWTTDFDCGYETNWWYCIKDAPFDIEQLSKNSRKHIRQALKKCTVKKIHSNDYLDDLWRVREEAFEKYKNATNKAKKENFMLADYDGYEVFAGFDAESGRMIGWMQIKVFERYVEIVSAKFSPEYLHLLVSDAIYATVLDYALNQLGKEYVSSGERSINHKTNTQDYKIRHFGYRKAYCNLHLVYKMKIKTLVRIIYPFRKCLKLLDRITILHRINAIMEMEEISKKTEKS